MTIEIWRNVPGYEEFLLVSNRGRVKSLPRVVHFSDGRVRRYAERLRDVSTVSGRRGITINGERKLVAPLVLEAFVGPRPIGAWALHDNDVSDDDRLENLYWGTPRQNARDTLKNRKHYAKNKTHCPWNHRLVAPNLQNDPSGKGLRRCLACARTRGPASRARQKNLSFDFQAESDARYADIMGEDT